MTRAGHSVIIFITPKRKAIVWRPILKCQKRPDMATAVSRLRTIRANGARFNPQSEAIRKGSGALHWQALLGPSMDIAPM